MESYLLEHAADYGRQLIDFTGSAFGDADPFYRGVNIPLRFLKVAVFLHDGDMPREPGPGDGRMVGLPLRVLL
jgi:endonuclease G